MPFAVHRARGKHPLLTHFIPDSNDCFYAGSAYLSLSHCGILWALSGPLWQNPSDITTSLCPSTSVTLPAMLAQMEETQNPYSDGRTAAPAGAPKHHEDTELSLLYSRWRTLSFSYCSHTIHTLKHLKRTSLALRRCLALPAILTMGAPTAIHRPSPRSGRCRGRSVRDVDEGPARGAAG